jgi:hypothetical protein
MANEPKTTTTDASTAAVVETVAAKQIKTRFSVTSVDDQSSGDVYKKHARLQSLSGEPVDGTTTDNSALARDQASVIELYIADKEIGDQINSGGHVELTIRPI